MKDNLELKTNLDGIQTWMEDKLGWKTALYRRQPQMEDDVDQKITIDLDRR